MNLGQIASYRPIPNLPIVLALNCVGCNTRSQARAKDGQAGRDLFLAAGWVLFDTGHGACPRHNPSRTEFIGYQRDPKPESPVKAKRKGKAKNAKYAK